MNKIKEIYIEISDFLNSLSSATMGIIMGVIFATAFYNFALFIKANKGDKTKFEALGKFSTFLIMLGLAVFIIFCYNY